MLVTNGSQNQLWRLVDGVVQSTVNLPFWGPWPVQGLVDVDGDGDKDVLYQNAGGSQYAVRLNGISIQGEATVSGNIPDAIQPVAGGGVNEGTDTVHASISHTLAGGVENLVLTGNSDIDGTGNAAANMLTGNAGDNTLTGMGGADRFVFASGGGNDVLADFLDSEGDIIALLGFGVADYSGLQSHLSQRGTDVLISFGASGMLLVQQTSLADLTAAQFQFA